MIEDITEITSEPFSDGIAEYKRRVREMNRLNLRKFGPKEGDHPSVGNECPACSKPFKEGDFTTLVALGPGDDPEQQKKAKEGRPYSAVASEVHWECAGGK